jgi:hypothetical protein
MLTVTGESSLQSSPKNNQSKMNEIQANENLKIYYTLGKG